MSWETSLPEDFALGAARLRMRTLVRLRWIAVLGQSAAVLFVYSVLGYNLPIGLCFAPIALSAWLNLFLRIRYPSGHELSDNSATAQLAYDLLQLGFLLSLTGGLVNPFAILFLVPVVVSAGALPLLNTVLLGVLALTIASIVAIFHLPLPWAQGDAPPLPPLYIAGIWLALACGLAFMVTYVFRVAAESRQTVDALAAVELVLAREQHLSALDGLAAAAAHELGTPLATIALVARELERDLPQDGPQAEDIRLLRQQVERCRGILRELGSLGSTPAGPLARLTLHELLDEVATPHRAMRAIEIELDGEAPEPTCPRNPAMLHGLGNLVENAADFARQKVRLVARWTRVEVAIEIVDDGPGFAPEVLDKAGEPYVTTRRRRGDALESGLGLGLFIAKTLLQRNGAQVAVANDPEGGARISLTWRRPVFEGDETEGYARAPMRVGPYRDPTSEG
ncbi:ActS/PrrB/RegB family redox-sensitive histidine kinase [Lutibaculum baratangense]|uniref:histidine kinase n=1 Tax=Lutibaculum baratangense AMV1 TaxID=631454 RepID=V4RRF6_9HYPH|nr:ActS/PrrB/RegB family redox-sensitive histidine kinase [Lutibaculum baratangense]ESR25725.1 Sensor histidine kinase PrrB (RegB) [Lutibaculum baratangense AMV1]